MRRLSFRGTLLASSLLIAASLAAAVAVAGAAWNGRDHDQEDNRRALALSAAARQPGRAQRRSRTQRSPVPGAGRAGLARRFGDTLAEALPAVTLLEAAGPGLSDEGAAWRASAGRVQAWLANLAAPASAPRNGRREGPADPPRRPGASTTRGRGRPPQPRRARWPDRRGAGAPPRRA